jgi:hypothetical protein
MDNIHVGSIEHHSTTEGAYAMKIIARYYLDELEHKEKLLWWQERGLSYTATGYGQKIPTTNMVKLPGSNHWRRVYCCIFSNIGTCYVADPGGLVTVID